MVVVVATVMLGAFLLLLFLPCSNRAVLAVEAEEKERKEGLTTKEAIAATEAEAWWPLRDHATMVFRLRGKRCPFWRTPSSDIFARYTSRPAEQFRPTG